MLITSDMFLFIYFNISPYSFLKSCTNLLFENSASVHESNKGGENDKEESCVMSIDGVFLTITQRAQIALGLL